VKVRIATRKKRKRAVLLNRPKFISKIVNMADKTDNAIAQAKPVF